MAESIKCVLEVYDAATYSLSTLSGILQGWSVMILVSLSRQRRWADIRDGRD